MRDVPDVSERRTGVQVVVWAGCEGRYRVGSGAAEGQGQLNNRPNILVPSQQGSGASLWILICFSFLHSTPTIPSRYPHCQLSILPTIHLVLRPFLCLIGSDTLETTRYYSTTFPTPCFCCVRSFSGYLDGARWHVVARNARDRVSRSPKSRRR